MWLLCLLCMLLPTVVLPLCWEPGRNPDFTVAPKVTQLSVDRVRVSWAGLVTKEACVDNFVVKYWQRLFPRDYYMTPLVPRGRYFADIEVVPYLIYHFQAVAREEQGPVMGVDWHRSPVAKFQTSRDGGGVPRSPHPYARYDDGGYPPDYFDESDQFDEDDPAVSIPSPLSGPEERIMGFSPEVFVIYASLLSAVFLVAVGCGWNAYRAVFRAGKDDDDEDGEHLDGDDDKSSTGDKDKKSASMEHLQSLLNTVEEEDEKSNSEQVIVVKVPEQADKSEAKQKSEDVAQPEKTT